MNLIWATSVSAGALHAARALLTGRMLIDRSLAAAIQAPAEALAAAVAASGYPAAAVWQHLLPLAAGLPTLDLETAGHELAARVLAQIEAQASPSAVDRSAWPWSGWRRPSPARSRVWPPSCHCGGILCAINGKLAVQACCLEFAG